MGKRSYSVFYAHINFWNKPYSDTLHFGTEKEADHFINKLKKRMDVYKIIKISTKKFEGKKQL